MLKLPKELLLMIFEYSKSIFIEKTKRKDTTRYYLIYNNDYKNPLKLFGYPLYIIENLENSKFKVPQPKTSFGLSKVPFYYYPNLTLVNYREYSPNMTSHDESW